jgi:hypothetical protein
VFAAGVMIEHAQAQYIPPPTPLPPPVFNPSSPYTVPQPSYRSIDAERRGRICFSSAGE